MEKLGEFARHEFTNLWLKILPDTLSLFDWYWLYRSIGRDRWHTRFVNLFCLFFFPLSSIYIGRYICSSKNENWFHGNSKFVDNWVAIESRRIKQLSLFKKIWKILSSLQNQVWNLLVCRYPAFHDLDLPPFRRRCSSGCSYILE